MKKILLSLTLVIGLNSLTYSQLSLNEIYSEPGCGTIGTTASDWFELYNGTANNINLLINSYDKKTMFFDCI